MPEKSKSVSSASTLMPRMGLTGMPARTAALHAGHFFLSRPLYLLFIWNMSPVRMM